MEPTTSSQTNRDLDALVHNFGHIGRDDKELLRNSHIVIFNLDTSDQNTKYGEICQIAAWCNGNTFQEYIIPNRGITTTSHNGLIKSKNKLFQYGEEVNAVSPEEGLKNFLNFLSDLTGQTCKVLLAGHNCFSVSRHVIKRQMMQYKLYDIFQSLVMGFIDTLHIFKSVSKMRNLDNGTFALEPLAEKYLGPNVIPKELHAKGRVEILVQLIKNSEISYNCTDEMMQQHFKKLEDEITPLNKLSKNMQQRLAKANITFDLLKDTHKANGDEGVSNLLLEKVDGKVRVTKNAKIIKQIIDILSAPPCDEEVNATEN